MSDRPIQLIYDRQCPFCDRYSRLIGIRKAVGDLELVDARQPGPGMERVTALGLDIDQGMVLIVGDEIYYGSDAMHALALMSSRSGSFNRVNHWIFRSRTLAGLLYPLMRSCRNLLLKLMGKSKINNLHLPDNSRF
ncbi:MAG: DCC1-like thiol-disulfide oxidoreductase family protein [Gammaproteobacteria bacterium]